MIHSDNAEAPVTVRWHNDTNWLPDIPAIVKADGTSIKRSEAAEQLAIRDTIHHWKRMILWVSSKNWFQKTFGSPKAYKMLSAINEYWAAEHCGICHYNANNCFMCILGRKWGYCSDPSAINAWHQVNKAKTWRSWLAAAKDLLEQIEYLEVKK